jgi:putative ABC transport system permease protein
VFALVAGLAVLLATLHATLGQREHEMSIYRALGAQRALLMRMQSVELVGLGALAGLLGGVAAMLTASVLAASVFDFAWIPNVWLLPTFVGLGAFLSWATGAWMLRRVVQTPAWVKLRQLDL